MPVCAKGPWQVPDSCPGAGPCSGRKENQLNSGLDRVVKEGFRGSRYVLLVLYCVHISGILNFHCLGCWVILWHFLLAFWRFCLDIVKSNTSIFEWFGPWKAWPLSFDAEVDPVSMTYSFNIESEFDSRIQTPYPGKLK